MISEKIYSMINGITIIEIEGIYIQRFLNFCLANKINLRKIKHINSEKIFVKIWKQDFNIVNEIARKTNCKIKILENRGIPAFLHRYKKRKLIIIVGFIIIIGCFYLTSFIWNIEFNCPVEISEDEIKDLLNENGISIGSLKRRIDTTKAENMIRLKRDDISWIGIKLNGTNCYVEIVKSQEKPEIIDKNKITNIISNKSGKITKINVQSGMAKVEIGNDVNEGDILVEGIMEGKYTGKRYVNSQADIWANVIYSNSEKKMLEEQVKIPTGESQNVYKIYLNNFKINLNKGVSKFENYDTIYARKKLRLFSNYYLPIELEKATYSEVKKEKKTYEIDEITNELKTKLEDDIKTKLDSNYQKFVNSEFEVNIEKNQITVIVNCVVEEKIGIVQDLVF